MLEEQDCAKCRTDITEDPHKYCDDVSGEMTVCKECLKILTKGK